MCAGEFCDQQDYKMKSLFSVYRGRISSERA